MSIEMLVLRIEWKKSEDRGPETEEKKFMVWEMSIEWKKSEDRGPETEEKKSTKCEVRSTKWKKSEDRGPETEEKKYEVKKFRLSQ